MDINQEDLNGLLSQYGDLGEAYFFYEDTEQLRFDRKKWKWHRVSENGSFEPLYGVTSIVKIIDKSEALMGWAKKMAMAKLRRLMIERAGQGSEDAQMRLFIGELDQIIAESKKADEEELDKAGDTGHSAHDWIEQYIKSVLKNDEARKLELLAKFPVDERAANCCIAVISWMADHNVRWCCTERKVFSRKHRYAGTMDGLAVIDSCSDPNCCRESFKDRLSIVDWKTSNYLYIEYLYQTAAYQQAYEEETGEAIEDRWVVRLGKENAEFDPWHCAGRALFTEDWEGYLACLTLYQNVERTEDRIANIKGMRKAILQEIERKRKEAEHKIKCPKADDYQGKRKSKCLPDGTQCKTCREKYEIHHPPGGKHEGTGTSESVVSGQSVVLGTVGAGEPGQGEINAGNSSALS